MLRERDKALARGHCARCGNFNLEFLDERSRREYNISALCQNCQDIIFDDADIPTESEL